MRWGAFGTEKRVKLGQASAMKMDPHAVWGSNLKMEVKNDVHDWMTKIKEVQVANLQAQKDEENVLPFINLGVQCLIKRRREI